MVKLNFHNSIYRADIQKVVIYISKMTMHDYGLLSHHPLKYLAASCLFITFKIVE